LIHYKYFSSAAWITRHIGDDGKVICKYCKNQIRAHKNDLLEHTKTIKHRKKYVEAATPEEYSKFCRDLAELTKQGKFSSAKNKVPVSVNCTSVQSVTPLSIGSPIDNGISFLGSTLVITEKDPCSSTDLSSVFNSTEELWQESEDFTSTESPSDLVSVILEEQKSPSSSLGSMGINANGAAQDIVATVSNLMSLNNFIGISGASLDSTVGTTTTNSARAISDGPNVTLGGFTNNISDGASRVDNGIFKEVLIMKNSSVSLSDVLESINSNYFTMDQLCTIAKAAIDNIQSKISGGIRTVQVHSVFPTSSTTTVTDSSAHIGTHVNLIVPLECKGATPAPIPKKCKRYIHKIYGIVNAVYLKLTTFIFFSSF